MERTEPVKGDKEGGRKQSPPSVGFTDKHLRCIVASDPQVLLMLSYTPLNLNNSGTEAVKYLV